ncbi:MAG: hypothetical protein ACYDHX_04525 [Methanothrix sp.]
MEQRIDKTFVKIWTGTIFKVTLLILLIITPVAASDWPQFQRDEAHSGLCLDDVPMKPHILWSADLLRVDVTPIISSDKVSVLAGNGSLLTAEMAVADGGLGLPDRHPGLLRGCAAAVSLHSKISKYQKIM